MTEEPGGLQSMGSQRVGHDLSDYADDPGKLLNTLSLCVKNPLGNHFEMCSFFECPTYLLS